MNKKTILLLGLFLTLILFGAFSFAVSETQESCFVQEDGGWIYYLDDTDFGHLYKVKKDGTLKTKVYETSASEIIIVGDWIYYIKGNCKCRCKWRGNNTFS